MDLTKQDLLDGTTMAFRSTLNDEVFEFTMRCRRGSTRFWVKHEGELIHIFTTFGSLKRKFDQLNTEMRLEWSEDDTFW